MQGTGQCPCLASPGSLLLCETTLGFENQEAQAPQLSHCATKSKTFSSLQLLFFTYQDTSKVHLQGE